MTLAGSCGGDTSNRRHERISSVIVGGRWRRQLRASKTFVYKVGGIAGSPTCSPRTKNTSEEIPTKGEGIDPFEFMADVGEAINKQLELDKRKEAKARCSGAVFRTVA